LPLAATVRVRVIGRRSKWCDKEPQRWMQHYLDCC